MKIYKIKEYHEKKKLKIRVEFFIKAFLIKY